MSDARPPRPRQVTLGGWLVLGGSVLAVVLTFDRVAGLGSMESQESMRTLLEEPPFDATGLDVGDLQAIVQAVCLVAGGAAAAAAILGHQVLQGSRGARRALAFLAPVLLVAGWIGAGVIGPVVAVGVLTLWSEPARAWFEPGRRGDPTGPPAPRGPSTTTVPRAAGGAVATETAPGRPGVVTAACVVTWVSSGLVALAMAAVAVVVAARPAQVYADVVDQQPELADQGVGQDLLVASTVVLAVVVVLWCAAAAVVAVMVLRRRRWAVTTLLVSAVVSGLLCLVASIAGGVAVVPLVGCAAVVALLLRPESRAWFASRP